MESQFFNFKGVDRRRSQGLADMKTAWNADNLYLGSEGVWRLRPGTRTVAELPPETKGLYSVGGSLRTATASGFTQLFNRQTPKVLFDFVGGTTSTDAVDALFHVETYGVQRAIGVQPYAMLQVNGKTELHWFTDRPDTPSDNTFQTKVDAPFTPSVDILKLATKIWAIDNKNGTVWFSSTANGPNDFEASNDAGFLPVLQHAPGSSILTALGNFRDRLVVFFEDALQIWAVDPDPVNHTLVSILNGPGTKDRPSVVNARGDLLFYSRGGFRSLTTQTITGELREGDIGAPLADLDNGVDGNISAAIWWQALGAYLVAVGDTVYCWRNDPLNKLTGWSTWTLPVAVDSFAELGTDLYYRGTDNTVRQFTFDSDKDDTTAVDWSWRSQFLHMGQPSRLKATNALRLFQSGSSRVTVYPDPTDPDFFEDSYASTGITESFAPLPAVAMSDAIAIGLNGSGSWSLDGFTIEYSTLG